MSQNHAHTNSPIELLSKKLADTVGKEILISLERKDQEEVFEQMLISLYNCYSKGSHMTGWCGIAWYTIEILLSKLEKNNETKINYHSRTTPQISLMAEKLTNTVGNTVYPFSDKEEQLEFFDLMLDELLVASCVPKYTTEGAALNAIKALLSKLD
ncbi:MAG: hypothetical protein ACKN9F_08700 [Methylomonas sp.]